VNSQPDAVTGHRAHVTYLVGACFLLALAAAGLIPRIDLALNPASTTPGVISFLGVGLAVLILTAALFFAGLRRVLPKTAVFLGAAFGYNALLVIVKFALGPVALYVESEKSGFVLLTNPLAFPGLTAITAVLYASAFFVLYAIFHGGMQRRLGISVRFERGIIQLIVFMFLLAVAGGVTVIGLAGFLEYSLSLLLGPVLGLLIAVALVGAIVLASLAFKEAADQAVMTRNVAVLSTFAWIGLAFIAAYHIVWFVFLLTLVSLWPLKAYSAK
jgi:hypothetical protein